jgi:hypothetical protein
MKSFHSLVPFLPLFCSCQFRRLNSIQSLCSQAHIPGCWRPETRIFISRLLFYPVEHFLITTLHGPRRKDSLYFYGGMFTDLMPSNRRLVARVYLRGNSFPESLPSNGYIQHSIIKINCKQMRYVVLKETTYMNQLPWARNSPIK